MNTQTYILTNGHTKSPPNFDIIPLWLSHCHHNACIPGHVFQEEYLPVERGVVGPDEGEEAREGAPQPLQRRNEPLVEVDLRLQDAMEPRVVGGARLGPQNLIVKSAMIAWLNSDMYSQ